jgi:hypothetical protein
MLLTLVPIDMKALTAAIEINPATNAYSIAVAPTSSAMRLIKTRNLFIGRCPKWRTRSQNWNSNH